MPTVIDLAQKVKAKYPGQYDDLSDAELGSKIKAKFPGQYDDFADIPKVGMGDVQASPSAQGAAREAPKTTEIAGQSLPVEATNPVTEKYGIDPYAQNPPLKQNLRALGAATAIMGSIPASEVAGPLVAGALRARGALPLVARMAGGAAAGGTGGALWGAGASKADTVGGVAEDALKGGTVGAATGGVLPAVGSLVSTGAQKASSLLNSKAIEEGRKAIAGVINSLSAKKTISPEAVEAAFEAGAIRPGYSVANINDKLLAAADPVAEKYAAILADLESKGVTGPKAQELAAAYLKSGAEAVNVSASGGKAGTPYARALNDVGRSIGMRTPDAGDSLGLMQAEQMKRNLQAEAQSFYRQQGAESLAGAGKKEAAARMRQAVEDAVAAQAEKAPEAAAEFLPTKEKLHRLLEAIGSSSEGAARYGRRGTLGLHEAMGLATGLATGNPVEAAGSAGLLNILKNRGSSTVASALKGASKVAGGLAEATGPRSVEAAVPLATTGPQATKLAALIDALRSRGIGFAPAAADEENR